MGKESSPNGKGYGHGHIARKDEQPPSSRRKDQPNPPPNTPKKK